MKILYFVNIFYFVHARGMYFTVAFRSQLALLVTCLVPRRPPITDISPPRSCSVILLTVAERERAPVISSFSNIPWSRWKHLVPGVSFAIDIDFRAVGRARTCNENGQRIYRCGSWCDNRRPLGLCNKQGHISSVSFLCCAAGLTRLYAYTPTSEHCARAVLDDVGFCSAGIAQEIVVFSNQRRASPLGTPVLATRCAFLARHLPMKSGCGVGQLTGAIDKRHTGREVRCITTIKAL